MKHNLPYSVMAKKTNSWDNVPRDAIIIPALTAAFGGGQVAAIAAHIVYAVAATAITSALVKATTPKPKQGLLTNIRDPSAPMEVVYGKVRKGGVITYLESTGADNDHLHQIITLAGHEVESIDEIYVNDKVATFGTGDQSEIILSATDGDTTDQWGGKIMIKKFTGASGQNVYSTLSGVTNGPQGLPSDFTGNNIACLYVRLEYDADVFTTGIPTITAVVKGKKVLNMSGDEQTYPASANPAFVINDYLTNKYGLNTPTSTIDTTSFGVAATDCDDDIDLSDGVSTEKRYTINGVVNTGDTIQSNLTELVSTCGGSLFYSAGKYKLVAGVYSSSVKTLTLDDLRSPINVATRSSRRDNFNSVTGTFADAGQDWVQVDYPSIVSNTFENEDGGYENPLDVSFPFVTSSATAQRLAKLLLYRAREQMTVQAEFGLAAFDLEVGDTVSLTLERYGWTEKEFEVVEWGLKSDGETGDLRVLLTLRETSSDAFDWDAEEQALIDNNSTLPSPFLVPEVGIALSSGIQSYTEKVSNKLKIDVTCNSPWAVEYVQVQIKYAGSSQNIKKEKLAYAILAAAVGLEPQETLFKDELVDGSRPLGDISDDGTVSSFDSLQYTKYVQGVLTDQDYIDYIEGPFHNHILSNPTKYQDYLTVHLDVDETYRDLNEGKLGLFEYLDAPVGQYDVRARAFNQFGRAGNWAYYTDYTLDDSNLPVPTDVTGFSVDLTDGSITLSWDAVSTIDLSYYKIRHSPETSGVTWSDSTTAVAKIGRPSTNVTLPARAGTFLVKAVSKTGKESTNAASIVVTSDQLLGFTTTLSQAEHTGFTGTKTETQVVGNSLELTSAAYSYPDTPASYVFSSDIDAGADRRVFARIDCVNSRRDVSSGLFDDLQGNFDSLPGLFDDLTGAANFGDTNVEFYIAVKPDGGSFGDYQKFRSGYFYGRYFRFKVEPKTTSTNITPSISELTAYVEYN